MKYLKIKTGVFLTAAGLFLTLNFMPSTSWGPTLKSMNEISQYQKILNAVKQYGIDTYKLSDDKKISFKETKTGDFQVEIKKETTTRCTNPHCLSGTIEKTVITDSCNPIDQLNDMDTIGYSKLVMGCNDKVWSTKVEEQFYFQSLSDEIKEKVQEKYRKILKESPDKLKKIYEQNQEKESKEKEAIKKSMLEFLE